MGLAYLPTYGWFLMVNVGTVNFHTCSFVKIPFFEMISKGPLLLFIPFLMVNEGFICLAKWHLLRTPSDSYCLPWGSQPTYDPLKLQGPRPLPNQRYVNSILMQYWREVWWWKLLGNPTLGNWHLLPASTKLSWNWGYAFLQVIEFFFGQDRQTTMNSQGFLKKKRHHWNDFLQRPVVLYFQDKRSLAKLFARIDTDGSGQLTIDELIEGAQRDADLQSRLRVMDIDESLWMPLVWFLLMKSLISASWSFLWRKDVKVDLLA